MGYGLNFVSAGDLLGAGGAARFRAFRESHHLTLARADDGVGRREYLAIALVQMLRMNGAHRYFDSNQADGTDNDQ
ncbi:MAG: hypothetical protein ACR2RE_02090 [Geminicoccaceae bacterium]